MVKRAKGRDSRPKVKRTISKNERGGLATMTSAPPASTGVQPARFSIAAKRTALVRSLHLDDPWLVGLMAMAFLLRLVFWIYTGRTWEDALITVLHSENFYHGLGLTHFKIDDPRPLHGFTSPISVLVPLLADRFHVGWGLPFQKLLSLLPGRWRCGSATGFCVITWPRSAGQRPFSELVISRSSITRSCGEWRAWRPSLPPRSCLRPSTFCLSGNLKASAIMSGLCLLARPDFILWTAIATAATAFTSYRRQDFKPLLTFVLLVCAVYGPWLIFTTLYYGSPIPNTIVAKSLGYLGYWETAPSFRWLLRYAARVFLRRTCLAPRTGIWR